MQILRHNWKQSVCEMYFSSMGLLRASYLSVYSPEESVCTAITVKDSDSFMDLLHSCLNPLSV